MNKLLLISMGCLLTTACVNGQKNEAPTASNGVKEFRITGREMQTMDGFGASDAWSMQTMGLWPEEKQTQAADWLFSMENDENGQPKGIGLSIWRFNVGGGSAEQGRESQISRGTRVECFLNADGTYDWNKQQGQRNFLKLAKDRGVDTFIAFLNSPPVHYTQNGLATNTGRGGTFNLKEDKYDDFARYLADVVEGVEKKDGIKFDYICPVNEPDGHWNWVGPKQEGTPATNREIAKAVRLISKEFVDRKLDTKILVYESSDYRCMFATHMTDWQRGYGIQSFFNPDSTHTYVGDLPNVPKLVVGHSYWTTTPLKMLHDYRVMLADTLKKFGVDFWQTETCIMGNDEEIGGGGGYDFTMKTALYVARIIHHDIVLAGARSWQWWRAAGGDYKDGLLRMYSGTENRGRRDRNNPDNRSELDNKNNYEEAYARDSKLLWAMGNYSRFVRPGAKRLDVEAIDSKGEIVKEGDTDPLGIMCTAYKNTDGSLVVVAINYSDTEQPFLFNFRTRDMKQWNTYVTSDEEGENLKPGAIVRSGETATLKAKSVTTFVCK